MNCAVCLFHLHTLTVASERRQKNTLMHLLEKDATCRSSLLTSQLPTAFLIDAMALIQMVKSSGSATFGELSQKYEDIVASTLIFDQYRSQSRQESAAGEENQALLK